MIVLDNTEITLWCTFKFSIFKYNSKKIGINTNNSQIYILFIQFMIMSYSLPDFFIACITRNKFACT